MAPLSYNQIVPKKIIRFNDGVYEVVSSHVQRKQQNKPVNQTKLKHLLNGKVIEKSFHHKDKVEEADIELREVVYLYTHNGEVWFHAKGDKSDRFSLPEESIKTKSQWLVPHTEVEALVLDNTIATVRIPIKLELEVTEAAPAVRGNTAQGATKQVTLASGTVIQVPLFIDTGDTVRINTETGEYVERVSKK